MAEMMTDAEVEATNFNPHPELRALEVKLDQVTAERDHLKADVKHQNEELDRLRPEVERLRERERECLKYHTDPWEHA